MAINTKQNPALADALAGFNAAIGRFNPLPGKTPTSARSEPARAAVAAETPESILQSYREQALAGAQALAQSRGPNELHSMTDYFIAAVELGENQRDAMKAQGIEWNPRVFANLAGHTIRNCQVNQADLAPTAAIKTMATLRAMQQAHDSGQPFKFSAVLKEISAIQRSGESIDGSEQAMAQMQQGIAAFEDTMDLDGNGTMAFYEAVDRHANFNGTCFENVCFHPAGTLMRDGENGIALTEGAIFRDCVFDGMREQDNVVFAGREFKDVLFTNIRGGEIKIADGSQINGMDLSGAQLAKLELEHCSLSRLNACDARIVELHAHPGAEINHSDFSRSTIGMNSTLAGLTMRHTRFDGSNVDGVSFANTTLRNVTFNDITAASLDLRGARYEHLTVNGEAITTTAQLTTMGVAVDAHTAALTPPVPLPGLPQDSIAALGATLKAALGGNAAAADSDLDKPNAGAAAILPRTVPPEKQAHGDMRGKPGSHFA
jgi:uncharacterized protein YjbI with pentapeptide repeats